jgi:hypothetical protein
MSVTPKDRQRIIELVEIASANKATVESTIRAIHQELPDLTPGELMDICAVNAEECRLDAAVEFAEAEACTFIADTLKATGHPNLKSAYEALALRSEQGDQHAAELLEQLYKAHIMVGDWIRVR